MLKGELGFSLVSGVATAADQELYTILDNKQKWLATNFFWPFLKQVATVTLVPGTGDSSRYYTTPTTISFESPVKVHTFWTNAWHPVQQGVGTDEYNVFSSGDASETPEQSDPATRWDFKAGDSTKIEVWPLPTQAQTLRFSGQRPLTDLKNGGATYVTSQTLDLDDLLVVLFAAAEKLSRMKKQDAQFKLLMAQERLSRLRSSYPKRETSFVLGGGQEVPRRRVVPIVTVA